MNCLISGDWILPYQPLLLSASSAQSLNLMRWKLYSGTLIPLPWNCRPLPLWIRITVSWLPMALPALFSALRLSHHQTTTVDRHDVLDGIKNVYIGDRGYCSYNNMAHVVEQGQYFLFRLTNWLFRKLKARILRLKDTKIKPVAIQGYELLDAQKQANLLVFLSSIGR